MMATVPHVISGLGLRKFQDNGFLLTRVYIRNVSSCRTYVCQGTPTECTHFICYVSIPCFYYMFRCISSPSSGRTYVFLTQKHLLYAAIISGTVVASYNITDTTLFVYNNFYCGYNHMCYITMLYVTNVKESIIKIFYLWCLCMCVILIGCCCHALYSL